VEAPLQPSTEGTYGCFNSVLYFCSNIYADGMALTPPFRPLQFAASYVRTARTHHDHVDHTLVTLHCQHEAVCIASSSLDLNVLAIADAFEGIATGARAELDKQAALLAGLEADLELISKIRIHVEFMSLAVRKAIEGGEKPRTLGDYVSVVKMKQVAETCARTHGEGG
jgi:autophagy-related protein 11